MCCTQPCTKDCGSVCKNATVDVKSCPAGYSEQWAPAKLNICDADAGGVRARVEVGLIAGMTTMVMTWGFI